VPLTIKSIKGYIYHNLIKKSWDDDKKMFTYSVCYQKLADALNEHFKPVVLFSSKMFKKNTLSEYKALSFCYSLLQDPAFQKQLKKDVKEALEEYENYDNIYYINPSGDDIYGG